MHRTRLFGLVGIKIKSREYHIFPTKYVVTKYDDNARLHLYWERVIHTIDRVNISLVFVVLKVIGERS